jgi:hypothetical protein
MACRVVTKKNLLCHRRYGKLTPVSKQQASQGDLRSCGVAGRRAEKELADREINYAVSQGD